MSREVLRCRQSSVHSISRAGPSGPQLRLSCVNSRKSKVAARHCSRRDARLCSPRERLSRLVRNLGAQGCAPSRRAGAGGGKHGPRVFDEKCSFRTALLRLFGNAVCRAHLSDLIPKAECEAQVKETACVQLPVVRFFVPQTTSTGILAFFDSDRGKCFSKPRGAEYTVCNLPTDSFDCALRIFIFEQREVRGSSPASLLRFFCFCRSRRPPGCLVS